MLFLNHCSMLIHTNTGLIMKIRLIAVLALSMALMSACASTPPGPVTTRNSELTHGNVQLVIKTGSTTQTEIIEAFGAPNITSIDGSGAEVWTYQRSAQVSQSSTQESYWTVILAGQSRSASGFETTSRMITLIIKFDKNKVVSDFRSRSSNF